MCQRPAGVHTTGLARGRGAGCIALLAGRGADPDLIVALGGPPARPSGDSRRIPRRASALRQGAPRCARGPRGPAHLIGHVLIRQSDTVLQRYGLGDEVSSQSAVRRGPAPEGTRRRAGSVEGATVWRSPRSFPPSGQGQVDAPPYLTLGLGLGRESTHCARHQSGRPSRGEATRDREASGPSARTAPP